MLSVAAADLNGDGKLDVAAANAYSGNVTVLLQSELPTAVSVFPLTASRTARVVQLRWRTAGGSETMPPHVAAATRSPCSRAPVTSRTRR